MLGVLLGIGLTVGFAVGLAVGDWWGLLWGVVSGVAAPGVLIGAFRWRPSRRALTWAADVAIGPRSS